MLLASPHGVPPNPVSSLDEGSAESEARHAWEVGTRALACYTGLLRVLRSPRWKRLMRANPDRLREVRELEADVRELLEDGAPHGVLRLQRKRLEALASKRLASFTRQQGASLLEVLGRLETLLNEPLPQPPGHGEPVLLEGTQGWRQVLSWPGSWVFALFVITNRHGLERHGNPAPLLIVGGALALYFHLRCSGRFWLTSKRVMWQPRVGEPVQVSLESIAPGGIRALPAWGTVRVEGDRVLTVRHAGRAGVLAALLDLHRRSPFLGEVDGTPRVREVSVLPAMSAPERSRTGQRAEPGVAVLRPDYAAFLPAHRYAEVFRLLAGPDAPSPDADVTMELLVEQLRMLPEGEFDVRMRQVVAASGGELWFADEVRPGTASGSGPVYRLAGRGVGMEVRSDSAQAEVTDRIVRRWAA